MPIVSIAIAPASSLQSDAPLPRTLIQINSRRRQAAIADAPRAPRGLGVQREIAGAIEPVEHHQILEGPRFFRLRELCAETLGELGPKLVARQRTLVAALGMFDRPAFDRFATGRRDLDGVERRKIGAFFEDGGALERDAREQRLHLGTAHEVVG